MNTCAGLGNPPFLSANGNEQFFIFISLTLENNFLMSREIDFLCFKTYFLKYFKEVNILDNLIKSLFKFASEEKNWIRYVVLGE